MYRDQYVDLEQQTILAKQRLRDIEEKGDDVKQVLADQTMQLESYRAKVINEIIKKYNSINKILYLFNLLFYKLLFF